jgi:Fic-DOC domain mobile mystery protein B
VTGPHDEPNDATPLTPDERDGLIPSHVTLRRELNELEQQNILAADAWAFARRHNPLTEPFARNLHRRMFGEVWRWAGQYRTSNKNIGVERTEIRLRLAETINNTGYWVDHKTYSADEIAARFHHGLVSIHPFPNGNGRWSRLMADVLLARLGQRRFSWGGNDLRDASTIRRAYIDALKAADGHDMRDLIAFVRS